MWDWPLATARYRDAEKYCLVHNLTIRNAEKEIISHKLYIFCTRKKHDRKNRITATCKAKTRPADWIIFIGHSKSDKGSMRKIENLFLWQLSKYREPKKDNIWPGISDMFWGGQLANVSRLRNSLMINKAVLDKTLLLYPNNYCRKSLSLRKCSATQGRKFWNFEENNAKVPKVTAFQNNDWSVHV